ncbi:hypothetical protein [Spirillospora albida]|uniref:hypothetical protein n=1 Tax=Spirillospora albida TaxID=58123 RepID=UPI00147026FA|nr:hypothetical protein [Spirillospora albida]
MAVPSDAPPIVYLHIGAPKSGTTFLQDLLWRNVQALEAEGVFLPGGSFGGQVEAMRDLRGLEPEPGQPQANWEGAWDRLADEVKASGARAAVISNEVICAVDAAGAERAVRSLAPCEVHIVYSARDLPSLLPSEWQEYIKHRYHYDFDQWLREVIDDPGGEGAGDWFWRVHDIPQVLGRWAVHVPADRIHVLAVPRPGAPRELLWERFAGLIGIDPALADLDELRANASLSWTETELLRRVNGAVGDEAPMWLYHRFVTDVLALQVLPGLGTPGRVPLPADRGAWAAEKAHELIDSIRSSGYDVVGDLDELLPREPAGRAAEPGDAEVIDTAAHAIVALLDEVSTLREELGALRRARAEQERTALPKLMARRLSERSPAVWKMRVGYWHLVERIKGIEPPPPVEQEDELSPVLSRPRA